DRGDRRTPVGDHPESAARRIARGRDRRRSHRGARGRWGGGSGVAQYRASNRRCEWHTRRHASEGRRCRGTEGGMIRVLVVEDDPATAAVPIVLATAHAMRGDAEAFVRQSGADGYVSKPILDHAAFITQVQSTARKAA